MAVSIPLLHAATGSFDVVVIGGTSSGVGAAVLAARNGMKVALVEETTRLGGMISSGVSKTDLRFRPEGSSGLFEEFRLMVKEYYHNDPACDSGLKYEPELANRLIKKIVFTEPNIKVFFKTRPVSAIRAPTSEILGAVVESDSGVRSELRGSVTVDATDEADFSVWAGAQYRLGRKARSPEEPHAGVIYLARGGIHTQTQSIPHPYKILPGSTGQAVPGIQGFSFRMDVKDYGIGSHDRTHVLKTPPPDYDRNNYIYGVPWAESWAVFSGKLPNNEYDVNNYPYGVEMPGGSRAYIEGDRRTRDNLRERYKNRALGYLYYLQHEEGKWNLGLADDEYPENGHFPVLLYVREGRRIMGGYVLSEADINPFLKGDGVRPPLLPDAITIGTFPVDVHPVYPKRSPDAADNGEGEILLPDVSAPLQIPFRCLVPRGVDGLLVTQAISSTHIGFQGSRLETIRMGMGMAGGIAAAMAVRAHVPVRRVNVSELQSRLLDAKSILYFYRDVPIDSRSSKAVEQLSLLGGFTGYDDYRFRPDQSITRAEFVEAVVRSLDLPISVTHQHFRDVNPKDLAFRYVDTLYDRGTLECFNLRDKSRFEPSQTVTIREAAEMLLRLTGKRVPATATDALTRGVAAEMIDSARNRP